jgi:hypothetical protein
MTYFIVLEQENDLLFVKWNAAEQAASIGHKGGGRCPPR